MDIIYGDVSSLNVIYRLVPEPGVFLIDCDAVRINSNGPVVPQLHSPDWDPPECLGGPYRNIQSKTTDRYKLGLFILRCLSPGIDSSQLRDPESAVGALDETGMDLLRRSLSTVPGNRPTATTWYKHFRDPTSTAGRAAGRAAVSVPGATRSTPGYRLENGKWVRR